MIGGKERALQGFHEGYPRKILEIPSIILYLAYILWNVLGGTDPHDSAEGRGARCRGFMRV
jgi:hypothetical protein